MESGDQGNRHRIPSHASCQVEQSYTANKEDQINNWLDDWDTGRFLLIPPPNGRNPMQRVGLVYIYIVRKILDTFFFSLVRSLIYRYRLSTILLYRYTLIQGATLLLSAGTEATTHFRRLRVWNRHRSDDLVKNFLWMAYFVWMFKRENCQILIQGIYQVNFWISKDDREDQLLQLHCFFLNSSNHISLTNTRSLESRQSSGSSQPIDDAAIEQKHDKKNWEAIYPP